MPSTTENTIIAAFRSSSDAEAAATDLEAAGISRDDIYVESGSSDKISAHSKTSSREGGITGWFKSLFAEDDDPDRSQYENAISQGNHLLRVDVDENEISSVEEILNRHSPIDVHAGTSPHVSAAQAAAAQASPAQTSAARTSAARTSPAQASAGAASRTETDTAKAIPVVKEEVQIGKRQVLRGGVRVYSRVVEEPLEESVRLREEKVRVERHPVNRSATEADLSGGREQVIEVQEFAEEPVIAKQARVVEEVRV